MTSNNKKIFKTIVLFSVLALPSLVFLFLKSFGNNSYALEVFNPRQTECSNIQDSIFSVNAFASSSENANAIKEKYYVASFYYENCANCDKLKEGLLAVLEAHKENADLRIVTHYVADTISNTSLKEFQKDTPKKWLWEENSLIQLASLGYCNYALSENRTTRSRKGIDFINRLVLVDKQQKIRGYYNATNQEEIDRLIIEIAILKQEK